MEELSFKIINPGIFSLIQDIGRFSFSHLGVTNSGFLDEYAAFACNKLLNNSIDKPLIEIFSHGVILEATKNTTIAITGAYCDFFINDTIKKTWSTHGIKKGDILKIAKIRSGRVIYFGVKDGFNIKKEFGSNCVTLKENFGSKLKKDEILDFNESNDRFKKNWNKKYLPNYEDSLTLRVLLSYQCNSFGKKEKDKFFENSYEINIDSNRMACKLNGEKIFSNLDGVISEGIAYGAIQIPKDGQPIVLLKEAQTIGGYPKIGSVLSIDCFRLAQMKIGTKIKFEEIDIYEAQKKLKEFYSSF